MKKMNRFLAALLSVFMLTVTLTSLAPTASAVIPSDGKITISGTNTDVVTYKLYRMLDLESYNNETYSYRLTGGSSNDWYEFITTGAGKDYLTITDTTHNYIVAKSAYTHESQAVALAQAALEYITTNSISPEDIAPANIEKDATTITFKNLPHGYYVVESSRGTALILDTIIAEGVTVVEKNNLPAIAKEVQENLTANWGTINDADVGETVNYRIIVTAANDAKNYVIHDKMADGLEYNGDLVVKWEDHSDSSNNKTLTPGAEEDYLVLSTNDDCLFEVVINQSFISTNGVSVNDKFILEYSATLLPDSGRGYETAKTATEYNKNTATLKFGGEKGANNTFTGQETRICNDTITYTYDLTVYKKAGTTPLAGAQFLIKKGSPAQYLHRDVDNTLSWGDKASATLFTSAADGTFSVSGLDAGVYYLEEVVAPNGYNKLSGDITFTLSANHTSQSLTLELSGSGAHSPNREYRTGSASFVVENVAGKPLPSTGGIGTTIFYTIGGVLIIGALSLLLVRKRNTAK